MQPVARCFLTVAVINPRRSERTFRIQESFVSNRTWFPSLSRQFERAEMKLIACIARCQDHARECGLRILFPDREIFGADSQPTKCEEVAPWLDNAPDLLPGDLVDLWIDHLQSSFLPGRRVQGFAAMEAKFGSAMK